LAIASSEKYLEPGIYQGEYQQGPEKFYTIQIRKWLPHLQQLRPTSDRDCKLDFDGPFSNTGFKTGPAKLTGMDLPALIAFYAH
jgi:hypothetical protein